MKKVDTSSWGEFRLKDIFDTIARAKRRTITSYVEGDTPYVTNSTYNNGISAYLSPKDSGDIESGHCITVNTVDGSTFWQERDFLANSSGNGLLKLYRDGMDKPTALFLCAAIKVSLDPNFTVMLTTGVVKELIIKLPQTSSGAPDWEYMERIMRDHLNHEQSRIDALQSLVTAKSRKVDTSSWGEFRLKDIFDTIARAKRRTITSYVEGDTPYVTNSTYNNGISAYLSPKDSGDIESGHCITVNTVDGSTFWQERDFLANSSGNGLLKLYRDGMDKPTALFLCAAIKVSLDPNFTVMLTTGVVKELIIKLPQTSSGAPDWEYMRHTMETLLVRQETNLNALQELGNGGE